MTRYKKLTQAHQVFVNLYLRSCHNPIGLYKRVFFCEDGDLAIVCRSDNEYDAWGCVNMANQLIVPFGYAKIINFGHFLLGITSEILDGQFLYDKKGKFICKVFGIINTHHKTYSLLIDECQSLFRLSIRKMSVSNGLYRRLHVLDNGLCFMQDQEWKVGLNLFSKLKLPFEYEAIAIPQNGYTLGIIESGEKRGEKLYDCQLIKVRNQISKDGSIHPTGITLFEKKTYLEFSFYFSDKEKVEKDCNSLVCYNEKVHFNADKLQFFPYDTSNISCQGLETEYEKYERPLDWDDYSHD